MELEWYCTIYSTSQPRWAGSHVVVVDGCTLTYCEHSTIQVHVVVGHILSLTSLHPLLPFPPIPSSLLPPPPPPCPPPSPPFYPVWRQPSQGGGEFVVCSVYMASEHSCHTELPCTLDLCLWQCGSNVTPGKASDGVLQSEADRHHRHRTDEGPAGGSWRREGVGGGRGCM